MQYSFKHLAKEGKTALALYLILAALFCSYYVLRTHVGVNSSIAEHAMLNIDPPFLLRIFLPLTLSLLIPIDWLDLAATRIVVATGFTLASLWMMPAFMERLLCQQLTEQERTRARLMLLVMLVAHYILPRNLKFYYIYDLPAISFYLLVFLALTSERNHHRWLGVVLAALSSTNRETVGVAVVHALAWHAIQIPRGGLLMLSSWGMRLWQCVLATLLILTMRKLTAAWLDYPMQASFSWMEGDQVRILANLQRMVTKHHHGIALLWFGAGAIIWLPRKWKVLPSNIKALIVASLPVFVFFCIVGNFVELRMFSELLPLLAVALAFRRQPTNLPSSQPSSGEIGTGRRS